MDNKDNKVINRKGLLLMKNLQDKMEYHLYDNTLPYPRCAESIDINDILESYYQSREDIYLKIENNDGIILSGNGRLHKKKIDGVVKYYLDDVDLENIFFNHTDELVHIVMKRINDVVKIEGENNTDEPREDKS
jgi:hypothetical protein